MQKRVTAKKFKILPERVCFRDSNVYQHFCEQRCLSIVRNVCVWVVCGAPSPTAVLWITRFLNTVGI